MCELITFIIDASCIVSSILCAKFRAEIGSVYFDAACDLGSMVLA